jgi:acetoin utilization protein AcuB
MNAENTIREIMTANLVTVTPDTNAKTIKDIFDANDFHHLPVVENGEVLSGIISKEDFFKVSYVLSMRTTGKTWSEHEYASLKARDFMTRFPLTLDPEDTIGLAADIFLANKFHALPIAEEGRLVGLVTTHDLLKWAFNPRFVEKGAEEWKEQD